MKGLFDRAAHFVTVPTPMEEYHAMLQQIRQDVQAGRAMCTYDVTAMGMEYACELFKTLVANADAKAGEFVMWNTKEGLLYLQVLPPLQVATASK